MRLADVVAASSCIPVGLEPLTFPDDFRWPDDEPGLCLAIKARLRTSAAAHSDTVMTHEGGLAIMDGGVYDNQGIESVLQTVFNDPRHGQNAARRSRRASGCLNGSRALLDTQKESGTDLGTFIISDAPLVAGSHMAPETPPGRWTGFRLRHVDWAIRAIMALGVVTILYLIGQRFTSQTRLDLSPSTTSSSTCFR